MSSACYDRGMSKSFEEMQSELASLEAKKNDEVFERNEAGELICPKHKTPLTEIAAENSETLFVCDDGETFNEEGEIINSRE